MWELYDSLVNEIPTERKVAAAFVGNCWTVVTADGKLSAHFEHTVAITPNGAEILTKV